MGVVSDAIDSLEDWCRDLMKDGIKSQFDDIASMMNDTFSKTTGSGGLINTFLAKHPAEFTGSTTGAGSTIWTTAKQITYYAEAILRYAVLVVVQTVTLFLISFTEWMNRIKCSITGLIQVWNMKLQRNI